MAPRKSERIMNLAICLLLARRFLDKNHIRDVVEGYAGLSDAAFERTFERVQRRIEPQQTLDQHVTNRGHIVLLRRRWKMACRRRGDKAFDGDADGRRP